MFTLGTKTGSIQCTKINGKIKRLPDNSTVDNSTVDISTVDNSTVQLDNSTADNSTVKWNRQFDSELKFS